MTFELDDAVAVLTRTPHAIAALLRGLPDAWTTATEGPDTWSAYDVIGRLIHGERTDWIPRAEHLLAHGETSAFPPFDRVTLQQHLSTWVAHDLDHIVQIGRVMARQYAEAVGPWRSY